MKFANILASAWHAPTRGHLLVVEGALLLPLEGSLVLPELPDPLCFPVAQLQNLPADVFATPADAFMGT